MGKNHWPRSKGKTLRRANPQLGGGTGNPGQNIGKAGKRGTKDREKIP